MSKIAEREKTHQQYLENKTFGWSRQPISCSFEPKWPDPNGDVNKTITKIPTDMKPWPFMGDKTITLDEIQILVQTPGGFPVQIGED